VVSPFATNQLKVTVTAVTIDANGIAKVAWSDTLNGTQRAVELTVVRCRRAQGRRTRK
jgi:hypothetical protein